ncbi:MAG: hypothetical protein ACTS22_04200 [Phycisphaerales bacterium]
MIAASIAVLAALVGCTAPREPFVSDDPLTDIRDPAVRVADKLSLVDQLPELVEQGELGRPATIEALKDLAWSRRLASQLRVRALTVLVDQPGLLAEDEAKVLLTQMLPTERDPGVTAASIRVIADRGWTDAAPVIVRRYAHPEPRVPDEQRIERAGLQALYPDRSVEDTVFRVFLDHGPRTEDELAERTRRDAWNLLSRLDATGEQRVRLLGELAASEADPYRDPTLASLRRGLLELRTIPLTGEELEWLLRLADPEDHETDRWWSEANAILRTLDAEQRRGLRLRHVEPIRFAADTMRDRTRVSREALLRVLDERMQGRAFYRRTSGSTGRQDLETWADRLTYGDLVAILTVDEAIREPRVAIALFEQAEEDRADTTTEYGGVIQLATSPTTLGRFAAISYPPRPITREGDRSFVASREMIEDTPRALAHYHFHVQQEKNRSYAGPSDADMLYAARYGRTCVVFTSIDTDVLNADVYLPNGAILDLGEIRRPSELGR